MCRSVNSINELGWLQLEAGKPVSTVDGHVEELS